MKTSNKPNQWYPGKYLYEYFGKNLGEYLSDKMATDIISYYNNLEIDQKSNSDTNQDLTRLLLKCVENCPHDRTKY